MQRIDEKGAVLIEFAIVWPIMFLIVFSGIEYSRSFRNMQMAASLSREAASVAYRDCASDIPGDEHLSPCLIRVRNNIERLAENLNEGSKIVISVYGIDSGSMERLGISPSIGNGLGTDLDNLYFDYSRFSPTASGINGNIDVDANFDGHRRIVIAEAWVPFQPLLPGYASIANFLSDNFYDSTVL